MTYERALARLQEGRRMLVEAQEEINSTEIEVKSRDRSVTVTALANGQITGIRLSDSALATSDVAQLETRLLEAVQTAQKAAVHASEQAMQTAIPGFSYAKFKDLSQGVLG